jgi:oligopeptide transport system substrate-binding protein
LGAYKLKVWDHDKALVLERNDSYYGEKAKVKNVIGYMINEYSTALNLFESGRLDYQNEVPYNEIPSLKTKPGFRQIGLLGTYYYGFNTRKAPTNNVKVRKAIAHAIDRKQITDLLGAGMAPLSSWIPTGMFGYEADRGLKFDPELARKLLDEAGYKDRSKFPRLTLGFNSNENHQRIAENVQAQLKKNLGISVELMNEEWKVYLNHVHTDPPSIYRMGWLADYPDPDNFMNLMTSYSDNNYTGWKSKEYDALVEEGASSLDKEKRRQVYSKAQALLTEQDVPAVPIYSMVAHLLISDRLQNFPVNAMDKHPFKDVSIK